MIRFARGGHVGLVASHKRHDRDMDSSDQLDAPSIVKAECYIHECDMVLRSRLPVQDCKASLSMRGMTID